jgi:hypothetical protein
MCSEQRTVEYRVVANDKNEDSEERPFLSITKNRKSARNCFLAAIMVWLASSLYKVNSMYIETS